jgi:uncharacterized protein YggE
MNRILAIVLGTLLVAVALAHAQPAPTPDLTPLVPTITVTGRGEVMARPDRAVVRVGAATQAATAAAAQQQVNEIMTKAIQQIRGLGIAESDIQTAGLDLSPVYANPRPEDQGQPRVAGYRASNTLSVRVDDLTKVGAVIDGAVGAGANEVQGITFQLRDDISQRKTALQEAARQARSKAEAIAAAMNVTLGAVQEVAEEGSQARPLTPMLARAAFDTATPVQPGELAVEARLTVRYRIVQR